VPGPRHPAGADRGPVQRVGLLRLPRRHLLPGVVHHHEHRARRVRTARGVLHRVPARRAPHPGCADLRVPAVQLAVAHPAGRIGRPGLGFRGMDAHRRGAAHHRHETPSGGAGPNDGGGEQVLAHPRQAALPAQATVSLEALARWCEQEGIETVVPGTADTNGAWIGKRVPLADFLNMARGHGVAYCDVLFAITRNGMENVYAPEDATTY